VRRLAHAVSDRLVEAGTSGRTVTLKVRHADFTTTSRSSTLPGPTDDTATIQATALALLDEVDIAGGLRLAGVGVSGLSPWVQPSLFDTPAGPRPGPPPGATPTNPVPGHLPRARWAPGADVTHREHGPGWVWGAGLGRVTIRFETETSGPGPVRTFTEDDPALSAGHPDTDADADADPGSASAAQ
jgi:DNA polymerase-4